MGHLRSNQPQLHTVHHLVATGAHHADFVEVPVNGMRHEMYMTTYGLSAPTVSWATSIDFDAGVANLKMAMEAGGGNVRHYSFK